MGLEGCQCPAVMELDVDDGEEVDSCRMQKGLF